MIIREVSLSRRFILKNVGFLSDVAVDCRRFFGLSGVITMAIILSLNSYRLPYRHDTTSE
jgi:hypothetical protein